MLQALIGPVANLASTWFQNKLEKTKADGEAKVAEAKARASVAEKVAAGKVGRQDGRCYSRFVERRICFSCTAFTCDTGLHTRNERVCKRRV